MKQSLVAVPFLLAASNLLAQDADDTAERAGGAAAGLIGGTCGCIMGLAGLALWIFLVVYVYRDSKARGMENAVLLTILTAVTGLLGFLIYLLMRPKTPPSPPQA
jgi:hypothetical protein